MWRSPCSHGPICWLTGPGPTSSADGWTVPDRDWLDRPFRDQSWGCLIWDEQRDFTQRLCACYTSPFLLSSGHLEAGRHPESCSSTAAQRRYGCSSANESPPAHMEPGGQLAFCSLAHTDAGPTHLLSGHIFARISFSPRRPFTPFKGALSSRQKPWLHLAPPFTLCCDSVHSAVRRTFSLTKYNFFSELNCGCMNRCYLFSQANGFLLE